jgi:hypothetical protein
MGIIKQGILGGFSGKVAGVVGSSWKGIAVMKSLPLSVANPRTAGQVAQRGRFANTVAFAGAILSTVIKPLWDRFASKMSGYNAFIAKNIELFNTPIPGAIEQLVIAEGKMSPTVIASADVLEVDKSVAVSWVDDSGVGFKLATDKAFLVVVNTATNEVSGYETNATRADLSVNVTFGGSVTALDVFAVYLTFARIDGTIVANNSFLEIDAA